MSSETLASEVKHLGVGGCLYAGRECFVLFCLIIPGGAGHQLHLSVNRGTYQKTPPERERGNLPENTARRYTNAPREYKD